MYTIIENIYYYNRLLWSDSNRYVSYIVYNYNIWDCVYTYH